MIGRIVERLGHGLVAGGVVGLLAGLVEFWLLWRRQAFAGDLVKGYWDIVLPHVCGVWLPVSLVGIAGAPEPRPRLASRAPSRRDSGPWSWRWRASPIWLRR